jgi:uncharacterized protein involved in exopolysaccharide biosynthesis
MDQALIKQINQRIKEELLKKEMETLRYALGEVEKIANKRHPDLAGLQTDLQGLVRKLQNRLQQLKVSGM